MKILFTYIIFLHSVHFCNAQYLLQDKQGVVMTEKSYTDVIGSNFFNDDYINGTVVLNNGKKYENLALKYDCYNDELFFKNEKDNLLLSFTVPVKSFELLGQKYINGLPPIDNFTTQSFYQVITDSEVKLLVKNYKTIVENKQHNSATIEKKFEDNKIYYVFKNGKMQRFKLSKKEFIEIFNDKSEEVDAFLKKVEVDFKNISHVSKIFEYFSSL